MAERAPNRLLDILGRHLQEILADWMKVQGEALTRRRDLISDEELKQQSTAFLQAMRTASLTDLDIRSAAWQGVRDVLREITISRARQGFSPSETAMFVFSLKPPLFARLTRELTDARVLADETWTATNLLDSLGLHAIEAYQKGREEVIIRQQQELMELSTPVVELWEGVLALPLIGTLDSSRTQFVMESLLQQIVDTKATVAIIYITGLPTVDTLVAQHLLKTVAAARLMGADCIISGIRPQIAQTIVHLGVDLGDVVTKASLADALTVALSRTGWRVTRAAAGEAAR